MKNVTSSKLITVVLMLFVFAVVPNAGAYTLDVASVDANGKLTGGHGSRGEEPDNYSTSISNDGNILAFASISPTYSLPNNPRPRANLVYRNFTTNKTVIVDISKQYPDLAPWTAYYAEVSGDGNFIAFTAYNQKGYCLFLYDIKNDTTKLLVENIRQETTIDTNYDGRYCVYYDQNDVNIYDRITNTIETIFHEDNVPYNWGGKSVGISDSGDKVVFSTKYSGHVYAYNRTSDTLTLLTKTVDGAAQNGRSYGGVVSANGKYALFFSGATNLVANLPGGTLPTLPNTAHYHIYVYDFENDSLTHANLTRNGLPSYTFAFFPGTFKAGISDDGRYVGAIVALQRYIGLLDRSTGVTRYFPMSNNLDVRGPVGAITPDGRYLSGWTKTPEINMFNAVRIDTRDISSYSVEAGPDQSKEQETAYGAYATLTGTLSAGTCNDVQIYRWSWPGGETLGTNPTIFLPPGTTTVTLDWSGCDATASDTVNVTVVDTTPPILAITGITGTVGNAGWYRGNVAVQLAAEDNGSGVAAIHYSLDGQETVVTAAATTVSVNGDGIHTLTAWAVDHDGNYGTPTVSSTIQIDSNAPAITGAALTPPNANGWYNTNVAVHFSATDTLSGIAGMTPDMTISSEGAGQSVTGTAIDVAGNQADFDVTGINLDRTSPLITINGVANGGTYNLGLVPQATYSASDALSGLDHSTGAISGTPDAFGCGTFTYTVTATDKAGNATTFSATYTVKATPQGTSALINELVNAGLMPAKTAETLLDTLARALSGYKNNSNLGDNMMNTFLNQVNAALNSDKINASTAALLNNAANYIMQSN